MASLAKDSDGGRRILFVHPVDGRRRTIRLPAGTAAKDAEAVVLRVERLVATLATGGVPDSETLRWVASVPDALHAKLAAAGLVAERQSATLAGFLTAYIDGRRSELKPRSLAKLEQTSGKLLAHFDGNRLMRTLSAGELDDWRSWLLARGGAEGGALSVAMVRTHSANAKTF